MSAIGLPRSGRRTLRVAGEAELEHGRSRYRFAPGPEPRVRVAVDFPAPVGRQSAAWNGDADDFAARIAPARTFGWIHELADLRGKGRAAAVDLESVLVFDDRGPIAGCRPPGPEEPARHKLLDLVGDLALYGGPPVGLVEAFAPGHTATHAVVARALSLGVLVGPFHDGGSAGSADSAGSTPKPPVHDGGSAGSADSAGSTPKPPDPR
jgi:UDP-3-O-[3-hydroxymyristoyl] N-acetylglucosamine deacetylase